MKSSSVYHCFFAAVCLSNLKQALSHELPLTACKTVFSHLKRDDSCLKIWTKPQPKNAKIHFQLTCIVQKHLCLSSQLSTEDIKRENLIKQRHPTCIKKVKMSPMWRAWDKENMKTVFWILAIGLELRQHFCTFNTALKRDLRQSYMTHILPTEDHQL